MTSILEKAISIIAPHHCFVCSKEGNVLCDACAVEVFGEWPEVCLLCHKPALDARICPQCLPQTELGHVWAAALYEGEVKRLIRAYKFERVRAAYEPLANAMVTTLPYMEGVVVTHVPTAPRRIRQRGYDHARLLAREIARQRGWDYTPLLRRQHNFRQVGSSRAERTKQALASFELKSPVNIQGAQVLLVDDVTTSGATLLAAGKLLARAGAARVDAVVAAMHTLE